MVARPGEALGALVDVYYDRGFELASRVSAEGEVTATIGSRRAAAARLRLDAPSSAYFLDPETGLREDLPFDSPVPAAALAGRRGGHRLPRGAPGETAEVTARLRRRAPRGLRRRRGRLADPTPPSARNTKGAGRK